MSALESVVATVQHQMRSEEYASCWVHQDCHVADEQTAELNKAACSARQTPCC